MAHYTDDLKNVHCFSDDIVAAGQPTAEQIDGAAAAGVRTVINLRLESEIEGFDEKFKVEAAGMRYVNIPIAGADDLDEHNARALDDALADGVPALVHCGAAGRVGALMACRAAFVHAEGPAAALAIGEAAGLDPASPLYESVRKKLG